jgi:class 3 adenylate cyclase
MPLLATFLASPCTSARVAALATPGEVLVSQTVRDLVAGSGVAFDDRGLHRLRGVPDEWRLFRAILN